MESDGEFGVIAADGRDTDHRSPSTLRETRTPARVQPVVFASGPAAMGR